MGAAETYQNLLTPSEGAAVEVINRDGSGPIVLVCEHASAFIPERLAGLGLGLAEQSSHAAWDPGALAVATRLSVIFDAPLVASRVSRLVYDCNRPPESPEAMRDESELIEIPGNRDLSAQARAARIRDVYQPFQDALKDLLQHRAATATALFTIHSFTPIYFGKPRSAEIGLLHDEDVRLAVAMHGRAPGLMSCDVALNQPYGAADGVTHTLIEHALPAGLLNVMIEIRNDLLESDAQVDTVSSGLAKLIEAGLQACDALTGDAKSGGRL